MNFFCTKYDVFAWLSRKLECGISSKIFHSFLLPLLHIVLFFFFTFRNHLFQISSRYAATFAAFVAGMACLVGIDFGAKLLALLAKCFEVLDLLRST